MRSELRLSVHAMITYLTGPAKLRLSFISTLVILLIVKLFIFRQNASWDNSEDLFSPDNQCDRYSSSTVEETLPSTVLFVSSSECENGCFLGPDGKCHPLLGCHEMEEEVDIKVYVGGGAVKQVYLAEWKTTPVAFLNLTTPEYRRDFHHGIAMLQQLQSSPLVVDLYGVCESKSTLLTQYYPLRSAERINSILSTEVYAKRNNIHTRFRLAMNYVEIIAFLHNSPIGRRVMCDSNDLQKTLSQFLVTEDLRLVVSDLDALPEVDRTNRDLIKCGRKELAGDFVAPEQLWPWGDVEFDDTEMPGYDEKTDIWKIPDVVEFLLGDVMNSDVVRYHLFSIHSQCKDVNPKQRPDATEILQIYERVYQQLKMVVKTDL